MMLEVEDALSLMRCHHHFHSREEERPNTRLASLKRNSAFLPEPGIRGSCWHNPTKTEFCLVQLFYLKTKLKLQISLYPYLSGLESISVCFLFLFEKGCLNPADSEKKYTQSYAKRRTLCFCSCWTSRMCYKSWNGEGTAAEISHSGGQRPGSKLSLL